MKSYIIGLKRLFQLVVLARHSAVLFCLFILISCKKESSETPTNDLAISGAEKSAAEKRPLIVVHAGQSIQAAINLAASGSLIKIEKGIYTEAIMIDKPDIQLVGDDKVIIQNPGNEQNGITVRSNGDGFVLKNVTIKDFKKNGLFMIRADNFLISHVTAINNGEYGLYPIFCNNSKMEHCEATGHNGSGLYIGQSANVELSFNKAYGNVNGIEVENCTHVVTINNQAYDNVAGILVVLLPGLSTKVASGNVVSHNHVYDNNHVNFAEPGQFESFVPAGSGILVVGSDATLLEDNKISNNQFVGIATVSTLVLGSLAGLPPEAFADIEPNADNTRVANNDLNNNGTVAPAGVPLPAADLLWDGSGSNNCWKSNTYSTSYPSPLPTCN